MPCYTQTEVSADVEKWVPARAVQAIAAAEMKYLVRYENGKLIAIQVGNQQKNAEDHIDAVKRKYAELTLKENAKKYGFPIKSTTTTKTGLVQIHMFRR